MNDDTRWCEVCGRPVTMPHPHPATKMATHHKLKRLAYLTANNIASGTVTASDVCDRLKEVQDPLHAAYLALNLASYLPDCAEVLIRNELARRIGTA